MAFHPLRASAAFHEHYLNLGRELLGDEAFEAARTEGRAMRFEQAVSDASPAYSAARRACSGVRVGTAAGGHAGAGSGGRVNDGGASS